MQHIQFLCCFRHIFTRQIQHRATCALLNVLVHLIVLSTHHIAVSDAVSAFLGLLRSWKRFLGKNLHVGRDTISNCFLSISLRQSSGVLVDILAEASQDAGVSLVGPCSCTLWACTEPGASWTHDEVSPSLWTLMSSYTSGISYMQPLAQVQISGHSKNSF